MFGARIKGPEETSPGILGERNRGSRALLSFPRHSLRANGLGGVENDSTVHRPSTTLGSALNCGFDSDPCMLLSLEFPGDVEFAKLLARASSVDPTLVALELARDAYPDLDFQHTFDWLARRGRELTDVAIKASSERDLLRNIGRCLAGTHGLHGSREAFQRPESSYLHRVIETGVGIPISLSLVYVAAAQRAGIELVGVASPMHFLVRYDGSDGTYFVDAFNQGRILSHNRCLHWLEELTQLPADDIDVMLEPANPREIVVRLLNNLKSLHVQQDDWEAAWKVQRRLTALQPSLFDQRRDLALVALKSRRIGLAVNLLSACLKDSPDAQTTQMLATHLHTAEHLLAEWN
jgi:regulator of sirC expression with transglutaminase-like and TPR domain